MSAKVDVRMYRIWYRNFEQSDRDQGGKMGRVHWRNIAGPMMCVCGHLHYGRVPPSSRANNVIYAQWHYCDMPECKCVFYRVPR